MSFHANYIIFSLQALAQKPAVIAEYISNYQQYAISNS
jgi:hypothetical protein